MATIVLDTLPQGITCNWEVASNALDMKGTQGGRTQRYSRLGTRLSMTYSAQGLNYEQGMSVVASVAQGTENRLRFPIRQEMDIGTPGSPTVSSGSGQTISGSGFTSGYKIKKGQLFSITHGGAHYLHIVTAAATATGGTATLSIFPMLRFVPTAGDAMSFAAPMIEGYLPGTSFPWNVSLTGTVTFDFTIVEAA